MPHQLSDMVQKAREALGEPPRGGIEACDAYDQKVAEIDFFDEKIKTPVDFSRLSTIAHAVLFQDYRGVDMEITPRLAIQTVCSLCSSKKQQTCHI